MNPGSLKMTVLSGCFGLFFAAAALGADEGVADLVAKMPGKDLTDGKRLVAGLVEKGVPAVLEICGMLKDPQVGGDAQARFALHGMVLHATRPGAEQERAMVERGILQALEGDLPAEVQAFLIRQVQLVGKDPSVAYLAGLLGSDRFCEPATQALVTIKTPVAAKALAAALPGAKGRNQVTLIQALGKLKDESCAGAFIGYAESKDPEVRKAAWYALSEAGGPEALEVLAEAVESESVLERGFAENCRLKLAARLAKDKSRESRDACAKLCRGLIRERTDPRENHIVCAALATLTETLGEGAVNDLTAAADSEDPEIRMAALGLAQSVHGGGVTMKWIEKSKTAPPELRAEIIEMLGRRGDWAAYPGIMETLREGEGPVRIAAIRALVQLAEEPAQRRSNRSVLIGCMKSQDPGEVKALKDAILRLTRPEELDLVKVNLQRNPNLSAAGRTALLEILAARNGVKELEEIRANAEDPGLGEQAAGLLASIPGPVPEPAAPDLPVEDGFVPLFNGSDLLGWIGDTVNYTVEDGRLVCGKSGWDGKGSGNLHTEKQYADFVLRFEFKLTPGANNGLGLRMPLNSHAAYDGMEIQILDDTAEKYNNLQPYQYHGSVYGVAPAKRGHLKPAGEWNEEEVIAEGRRIKVKLNGAVIVDVDLDEASTPRTMDGKEHPGLMRKTGHIAFLGHGDHVEFRNIRIKEK